VETPRPFQNNVELSVIAAMVIVTMIIGAMIIGTMIIGTVIVAAIVSFFRQGFGGRGVPRYLHGRDSCREPDQRCRLS
jgi:hypothetical protein